MPHVTQHTPKVSTRSVEPYACESSRKKRQQDRRSGRQTDGRTDRQTHRRIVQNHFSRRFGGCTSQIRSLSRSRFFARCQYFHWHGSNTDFHIFVAHSRWKWDKRDAAPAWLWVSAARRGVFDSSDWSADWGLPITWLTYQRDKIVLYNTMYSILIVRSARLVERGIPLNRKNAVMFRIVNFKASSQLIVPYHGLITL